MELNEWLDLLQWPAMIVTVAAAWLVAARSERRRWWGFCAFLASNVLWTAWAVSAGAWALVGLQFALAGLNIRGALVADE
jgi:predicted Kef-type K+ transport protein